MNIWNKYKYYIISIAIALAVGGLSALLTSNSMEMFESLNQPPLSPPSAVFPIVWAILFTLMGISAAIVYTSNDESRTFALAVYALQLVVNFFWPIIYFNLGLHLFAFIWLLLLIVIVVFMVTRFYKIKPLAAYLQIPYLLWLVFAAYLNFGVYLLNR